MSKLLNPKAAGEETGVPAEVLLRLQRQRKISSTKLGWRTIMFDPEKLKRELAKFETRAVV